MVRSSLNFPLTHRKDIDGLRALAVLGVVLYHFRLPGIELPGGFTGVDVFFVISGYLITQILVRDHATPGYLRQFFIRRIRRIFPALIVMIGVCLVAGYFLLIPQDYIDLSNQSRAATFALSNFYFLFNTGYFDPAAELQPLLHTWSLAVEEQFYLIWPVIVLVTLTFGRRWMLAVALAIVVISFCYSELLAQNSPTRAFYSPLSRAWELGLGALVALSPQARLTAFAGFCIRLVGLILVLGSFLLLDKHNSFPGISALYACLGTSFLIYPLQNPTPICLLLGLRPFYAIGLISYSLYLWHWPILVFFQRYQSATELSLPAGMMLLGVSLALATLSYSIVEKPFRRQRFKPAYNRLLALGSTSVVLVAAMLVLTTNGVEQRIPPDGRALIDRNAAWEWQPETVTKVPPLLAPALGFGAQWDKANFRVVIWGDSHAQHLAPIVERYLSHPKRDFSGILYAGCPAIVDNQRVAVPSKGDGYNQKCASQRAAMLKFLQTTEHQADLVILSSSWFNLTERAKSLHDNTLHDNTEEHLVTREITHLINTLSKFTNAIALVAQVPPWRFDPIACQVAHLSGIARSNCEILGQRLPPSYAHQRTLKF